MGVLVGKKAPDFTATAVVNQEIVENFKLSDYKGQYDMNNVFHNENV